MPMAAESLVFGTFKRIIGPVNGKSDLLLVLIYSGEESRTGS